MIVQLTYVHSKSFDEKSPYLKADLLSYPNSNPSIPVQAKNL